MEHRINGTLSKMELDRVIYSFIYRLFKINHYQINHYSTSLNQIVSDLFVHSYIATSDYYPYQRNFVS